MKQVWPTEDAARGGCVCVLTMTAAVVAAGGWIRPGAAAEPAGMVVVDAFDRPDTLYHGDGWESLNPGYWKIANKALRRRLKNVGDRNPTHWFPWHWETHRNKPMPIERDPSLPFGMIWRRDWKLTGNYTIRVDATVRALAPVPKGERKWKYHQSGYAVMGICFGGETLFESRQGGGKRGQAAWMALWRDNGTFGLYDHASDKPKTAQKASEKPAPHLKPGDRITIELVVTGDLGKPATVTAGLIAGGATTTVTCRKVDRAKFTKGYFGLVARGLLDFEVNRVCLGPGADKPVDAPVNELHVCYPLGDTLRRIDGTWRCRFMAICRNNGERFEIRVSDSPDPPGGWQNVPVSGSAKIVDNDFRRYTAAIDVTLPVSPADKTLYYTVWKDGRDVTKDPRTGFLGKKDYVGRLPRLTAPYRLCGLGGHAISGGGPNLPRAGKFQEHWVHDQPTPDAYKYMEDYGFQILNWEDDVWYLELMFCPPSTDDAYKIITLTIAGPTTRWQMMRHWNIINPGDHDYGMDDVKGPEQYLVRRHDDLGQDREYMRRNFKIIQHLVTGNENPSGTANPKDWRRWRMPNGDFSLIILNSRLWRTSQDTNLWGDWGWGHKKNVNDRTNPTRALLGEEQFAWLREVIRTDASPLICLTGINCLHPVWTGAKVDPDTGLRWDQRDRVAADYAGWVKAGADRVIELLGSRQGVLTIYGDIHLSSVLRNVKHRFYECSFGAIGRSGSRRVKKGFGPKMTDYDGRAVEIRGLYHARYGSPDLKPRTGPKMWSFLDVALDPRGQDPSIMLKIRNLIDPPTEAPRGGGIVEDRASNTGRPIGCTLPPIKTLPNAEVRLATEDGQPIRGLRSLADGSIALPGLIDVAPRTRIVMTVYDGKQADVQVVETREVAAGK